MPTIKFPGVKKRAVDNARAQWQSNLPVNPEKVGKTIVTWVEAAPDGDFCVVLVDQSFVDYLRNHGFEFQLA
jgi:hypothetical protein